MDRRHLIASCAGITLDRSMPPVRPPTPADRDSLAELMLDAYRGTIDYEGETLVEAVAEVDAWFASPSPLLEHSRVAVEASGIVSAVLMSTHQDIPLVAYLYTGAAWKDRGLAEGLIRDAAPDRRLGLRRGDRPRPRGARAYGLIAHRPMSLSTAPGLTNETPRSPRRPTMPEPTTTMTEPTTHTLDVPGAVLTYDVRRNDASAAPVLLIIGSPMGASGFVTLAGHFADRTVVTYDPRGVERSLKADGGASESTPDQHADDLSRLITALGAGPVELFASSGGAVNALALVAKHPEQVRTLVAHEPPAVQEVPDREEALRANREIHKTYLRSGFGPGMAKFIALVSHKGPITADYLDQPAPDPAMFGLPTEDDGSRTDPLLGQNMIPGTHYKLDFDALKKASTRIVIAVGVESEGELARRSAEAVAARLGKTPVMFPSGHGGFLGGEYGQSGNPDGFAAALRQVLDAKA